LTSGIGTPETPATEGFGVGTVPNYTPEGLAGATSMPNQYFNFFQNKRYDADRNLYENLLTEGFNIQGNPCMYYVVNYDTSADQLFGEDDLRPIERRFPIMAFFELPKEENLYGKFGLEELDNFEMHVSKKHFQTASQYETSGVSLFPVTPPADVSGVYPIVEPKQGDLLRAEYNNTYYEILEVKQEEEMFLQVKHAWRFIVRIMSDQNLTFSSATSGAMSQITSAMDQPDIMDDSSHIDDIKDNVLYTSGVGEESNMQDPIGDDFWN